MKNLPLERLRKLNLSWYISIASGEKNPIVEVSILNRVRKYAFSLNPNSILVRISTQRPVYCSIKNVAIGCVLYYTYNDSPTIFLHDVRINFISSCKMRNLNEAVGGPFEVIPMDNGCVEFKKGNGKNVCK